MSPRKRWSPPRRDPGAPGSGVANPWLVPAGTHPRPTDGAGARPAGPADRAVDAAVEWDLAGTWPGRPAPDPRRPGLGFGGGRWTGGGFVTPPTPRLGRRGLVGRGLGAATYLDVPAEFRGTSVQVCGLYPFIVGSSNPLIGVPIGHHTDNGGCVCFDPVSWFRDANLISNPSVSILARPGIGKSKLVQRMAIGLCAAGVTPLIMGDLRPDYRDMVTSLGGQLIVLGRGRARLNPLDPGALGAALRRLPDGEAAAALRGELLGRQRTLLGGLVALVRHAPLPDYEDSALAGALRVLLEAASARPPTITDLMACLSCRPERVRHVLLDRGEDATYDELVDPLLRSLHAVSDGPFGELFAGQSTHRVDLDAPAVSIDVSSISDTDSDLQAAALLAAWSEGFAGVAAAQALADAGLAPQRIFLGILDELWRVLRAGSGMVDRVDRTTRLNRADGMGTVYVTHTLDDFAAIASEQDRAKARGIISRTGASVLGGLTRADVDQVEAVIPLSHAERARLIAWSSPASFNSAGQGDAPPGQGKFLIKAGARPGVPVQTVLTPAELALSDTNARWRP